MVVLSILCAPALGASTSIAVAVERGADKAYVGDAAFDINVAARSVKKLLDEVREEILARAAR